MPKRKQNQNPQQQQNQPAVAGGGASAGSAAPAADAAVTATPATATPAADNPVHSQIHQEGNSLFSKGKYEEAISKYSQLADNKEEYSKLAQVLHNRSLCYIQLKDKKEDENYYLQQALADCEIATSLNSSYLKAHTRKIKILDLIFKNTAAAEEGGGEKKTSAINALLVAFSEIHDEGNELVRAGDHPSAMSKYTQIIDTASSDEVVGLPQYEKLATVYSNRSFCHTHAPGRQSCDKAIEDAEKSRQLADLSYQEKARNRCLLAYRHKESTLGNSATPVDKAFLINKITQLDPTDAKKRRDDAMRAFCKERCEREMKLQDQNQTMTKEHFCDLVDNLRRDISQLSEEDQSIRMRELLVTDLGRLRRRFRGKEGFDMSHALQRLCRFLYDLHKNEPRTFLRLHSCPRLLGLLRETEEMTYSVIPLEDCGHADIRWKRYELEYELGHDKDKALSILKDTLHLKMFLDRISESGIELRERDMANYTKWLSRELCSMGRVREAIAFVNVELDLSEQNASIHDPKLPLVQRRRKHLYEYFNIAKMARNAANTLRECASSDSEIEDAADMFMRSASTARNLVRYIRLNDGVSFLDDGFEGGLDNGRLIGETEMQEYLLFRLFDASQMYLDASAPQKGVVAIAEAIEIHRTTIPVAGLAPDVAAATRRLLVEMLLLHADHEKHLTHIDSALKSYREADELCTLILREDPRNAKIIEWKNFIASALQKRK